MALSKVPKFGGWEAEEEVGYTVRFETVRKGKPGGPIINPNDPQLSQFASPPVASPHQTKPKPKQPEFGSSWGEGENWGKVKAGSSEPQMNYNVGSNQPLKTPPVVKANEPLPRQGNTNTRPDTHAQPQGVKFVDSAANARQSPLHPRGRGNAPLDNNRAPTVASQQRVHATAGPSPGRGGASVPVFGDWENNPAQYTVMFKKLQDEKNGIAPLDTKPTHPNYSSSRPTQPKQGGCFSWLCG